MQRKRQSHVVAGAEFKGRAEFRSFANSRDLVNEGAIGSGGKWFWGGLSELSRSLGEAPLVDLQSLDLGVEG